MNDIDTSEMCAVDGGAKQECIGIFLGTYDGLYGVCIGYWG
jgi:hypothetical protein